MSSPSRRSEAVEGDPERDGWRAGRFGPDVPATERVIPYDGLDRLVYWQAMKEGRRIRAVLAEDLEEGERARLFALGG